MHRARMLPARAGLATLVAAAALGAGGPAASAAASPCGHASRAPSWHHIVVIAFENHSYADILGKGAPSSEFSRLASECGSATDYRAVHFPRSLPNYLGSTSGNIATTSDCLPGPGCRSTRANIFSQLGGRHWRTFAESMPKPCDTRDSSLYVPRHAPAIYYTRVPRSTCGRDVLALPSHTPELKRAFTWIAPNLRHDMHDGTPAQASNWLQAFLEGRHGLLHSRPYTRGHTAIFIWFDTASGSGSVRTPVPFIVISPSTPARVVRRPLDHYSSLRAWESMLHLPCVNAACGATGLRRPFNL
jgi:phosphatidylinositol-3-phosphatase